MNHILEQQKEALDNLHRNRTVAPSRADLHKIITQTHQATIAEVVRINDKRSYLCERYQSNYK
jgi:hypothetical protein